MSERSPAAPEPATLRPRSDGARVQSRIESLARFTEPDRPYTRLAFTDLYLAARDWLAGEFASAGLKVSVDAAGNLVGDAAGADPSLPALVCGSHFDTVPSAGRLDGVLGVIAALEVAQVLHASGRRLRHPFRIAGFIGEETTQYGVSGVGSRAWAGTLTPELLRAPRPDGEKLAEGIARMGGNPGALGEALVKPGEIAAYVELHIEQGPTLESRGVPIGVVEGIVASQRRGLRILGEARHAGTTPMELRRDALAGAAEVVLLVERLANEFAGKQQFVATVGRLDVHPNGANVVPGEVELVVEARSLDEALVDAFIAQVLPQVGEVTERRGLELEVVFATDAAAAASDERILSAIEVASRDLGLPALRMSSGAGHDAGHLAPVAPIGMIFVPSEGGVSHNPAENTPADQLIKGVDVLIQTVLNLDEALD